MSVFRIEIICATLRRCSITYLLNKDRLVFMDPRTHTHMQHRRHRMTLRITYLSPYIAALSRQLVCVGFVLVLCWFFLLFMPVERISRTSWNVLCQLVWIWPRTGQESHGTVVGISLLIRKIMEQWWNLMEPVLTNGKSLGIT